MPTAVTHQLIAEEVYFRLPKQYKAEIFSLPHYYLGAQGADLLFLYRFFNFSSENFGRFLHTTQPYLFFQILCEESQKNKEVRSYACGHITHYAGDTVFHPHIYGKMQREKGGTLLHHAMEHAYDGVLLKQYRKRNLFFYRLPKGTGKNLSLSGIYNVYARYASESGWGELYEEDFYSAIKRYYAFAAIRMPLLRKKLAERASELFEESVERGVALIERFLKSECKDLDKKEFSKHYLNGKIV
ncbi:MAG: zinc dependent phospholipase C family protein [Clostridia bacterium]|nr:zinc dependent phospholipase C family protein [Clostridia bacterium]